MAKESQTQRLRRFHGVMSILDLWLEVMSQSQDVRRHGSASFWTEIPRVYRVIQSHPNDYDAAADRDERPWAYLARFSLFVVEEYSRWEEDLILASRCSPVVTAELLARRDRTGRDASFPWWRSGLTAHEVVVRVFKDFWRHYTGKFGIDRSISLVERKDSPWKLVTVPIDIQSRVTGVLAEIDWCVDDAVKLALLMRRERLLLCNQMGVSTREVDKAGEYPLPTVRLPCHTAAILSVLDRGAQPYSTLYEGTGQWSEATLDKPLPEKPSGAWKEALKELVEQHWIKIDGERYSLTPLGRQILEASRGLSKEATVIGHGRHTTPRGSPTDRKRSPANPGE